MWVQSTVTRPPSASSVSSPGRSTGPAQSGAWGSRIEIPVSGTLPMLVTVRCSVTASPSPMTVWSATCSSSTRGVPGARTGMLTGFDAVVPDSWSAPTVATLVKSPMSSGSTVA